MSKNPSSDAFQDLAENIERFLLKDPAATRCLSASDFVATSYFESFEFSKEGFSKNFGVFIFDSRTRKSDGAPFYSYEKNILYGLMAILFLLQNSNAGIEANDTVDHYIDLKFGDDFSFRPYSIGKKRNGRFVTMDEILNIDGDIGDKIFTSLCEIFDFLLIAAIQNQQDKRPDSSANKAAEIVLREALRNDFVDSFDGLDFFGVNGVDGADYVATSAESVFFKKLSLIIFHSCIASERFCNLYSNYSHNNSDPKREGFFEILTEAMMVCKRNARADKVLRTMITDDIIQGKERRLFFKFDNYLRCIHSQNPFSSRTSEEQDSLGFRDFLYQVGPNMTNRGPYCISLEKKCRQYAYGDDKKFLFKSSNIYFVDAALKFCRESLFENKKLTLEFMKNMLLSLHNISQKRPGAQEFLIKSRIILSLVKDEQFKDLCSETLKEYRDKKDYLIQVGKEFFALVKEQGLPFDQGALASFDNAQQKLQNVKLPSFGDIFEILFNIFKNIKVEKDGDEYDIDLSKVSEIAVEEGSFRARILGFADGLLNLKSCNYESGARYDAILAGLKKGANVGLEEVLNVEGSKRSGGKVEASSGADVSSGKVEAASEAGKDRNEVVDKVEAQAAGEGGIEVASSSDSLQAPSRAIAPSYQGRLAKPPFDAAKDKEGDYRFPWF